MKLHDYRQLRAFMAAIAPLGFLTACSPLVDFTGGTICRFDETFMADLTPTDDADYIGLRSALMDNAEEPKIVVERGWGVPCENAADPMACATKLEAIKMGSLRQTQGGFFLGSSYDVVFSRGDQTGRIDEMSELLELLGTIDTPEEAALVAFAGGHDMPCDESNWVETADGYVLLGERGSTCGPNTKLEHYEVKVASDGTVTEGEVDVIATGDDNCAVGRRPDGLCSRTGRGRTVGQFFANTTHLEAASVPAFAQLARELAAHGAPRALVRAARRAQADEIRHARTTARLARSFGAQPILPRVEKRPIRPLFEVARDNGVEGCVRETFGALIATAQARRARSLRVRKAMAPIAVDETRHAVLSWAIDGWIQRQLTPRQRRAIASERREAVAHLRGETQRGWSESITRVAGMPDGDAGLRMLEPMNEALWTA